VFVLFYILVTFNLRIDMHRSSELYSVCGYSLYADFSKVRYRCYSVYTEFET